MAKQTDNFINYTPIVQDRPEINNQNNNIKQYKYNNEKQSNSVGNNFNITRQNKNIYRNNNSNNNSLINNKPLNNFNPSLIRRRGTPQGDLSSFLKRDSSLSFTDEALSTFSKNFDSKSPLISST